MFSFWGLIPIIEDGVIIEIDTKIEETTVIELKKRILDSEKQILALTDKIALENSKIELIESHEAKS